MDIQQQKKLKILLIGDNCVDEYHYGVVERLSPEAPVPIIKIVKKESNPGMAANVANNLMALGCEVIQYLGKTSHKIRMVDIRSKQQLLRIDNDNISGEIDVDIIKETDFDCIVVSDYCKGFVSYRTIENLKNKFPNAPIFIDTKKELLEKFNDCFVKINELEFKNAKSLNDNLIVTMGADGARIISKTVNRKIDGIRVEVADVTGAGDTFLSALAFMYMQSNDITTATKFAIRASSITVQHNGCYAPTLKEIECQD